MINSSRRKLLMQYTKIGFLKRLQNWPTVFFRNRGYILREEVRFIRQIYGLKRRKQQSNTMLLDRPNKLFANADFGHLNVRLDKLRAKIASAPRQERVDTTLQFVIFRYFFLNNCNYAQYTTRVKVNVTYNI